MKFEDFQGIEATHLDYKVSLEKEKPKSWLKSVVAFANTKGGHILFGVTDNGHEPVGLDDAQSTASKISELLTSRVEPPVCYTLTPFSSRIEGRLCIDLEVANGPHYPYYYVHEKTREIILKNFDIIGIQKLGDNAFMATDTKTIILFMRRKSNLFYSNVEKIVDKFLNDYKDVAVNGIEHAFSTYVNNVFEDLTFSDYLSILKGEPNKTAKESELFNEYKTLSSDIINKLEKEKLIYFVISYPQKLILSDSLEKETEKKFYGYEFSKRKGHEGIHMYKDENGIIQSKLYNPFDLYDNEKVNTYILKNFNGESVENPIENIKQLEKHPLQKHIDYIRLSDLMNFDLKTFEKQINLNSKKKIKIESKYKQVKLSEIANIDWGNTSLTKDIYTKKGYPAYSASGQDGYTNNYEYDTCAIIVSAIGARCGKCFKADGKFTAIKNTLVITNFHKVLRDYMFEIVNNENFWQKVGKGQPFIGVESARLEKLPLPPLEIQEKIVEETTKIEEKLKQILNSIKIYKEKILNILDNQNNTIKRRIGDILSLEYGIALPKYKRIKGEYPVVGANGIDGYHNTYLLNAPNIIIGRKGSVGKVNLIKQNCTPIDTCFYAKINNAYLTFQYTYYLLKSLNLEKFNKGLGPGGLNRHDIYMISVNIPVIEEQKRIVSEIEPLESEIEKLQKEIDEIPIKKQKILDKYLK